MPEREVRRRGGARRYRTVRVGPRQYIKIAVVPKAGARGGHTVAGRVKRLRRTAKGRKR